MKVCIETYGCSANKNNSEIMAGLLEKENIKLVNNEKSADIIILNTCIVKGPTESKEVSRIKQIAKLKKNLIVAGCMSQIAVKKIRKISEDISILGINNITEIVHVVQMLNKKIAKIIVGEERELKIGISVKKNNENIAIIQIAEGCLGNCTYCSVKFAKGDLYSYPEQVILKEIKQNVKQGIKEIWITSQDNGAYGMDRGENLVKLLKKIIKIEGEFLIRLGMTNPNHILTMLDDLIEIYKSEKIFKFLHIPVQSGNDEVLKKMNRHYSVAQFKKIISRFKKEIPGLVIATDIICGFSEETSEQFNNSLSLIKWLKPDVLNISKFWLRKKTNAENFKQLKTEIIKDRSKQMTNLFSKISLEKNKEWLGWEGKAILDEENKIKRNFIARNTSYKPLILKGNYQLGKIINVKIKDYRTYYLIA